MSTVTSTSPVAEQTSRTPSVLSIVAEHRSGSDTQSRLAADEFANPPEYEEVPRYSPVDGITEQLPIAIYSIFQLTRNVQILEPALGGFAKACYSLETKGAMSRKADVRLVQNTIHIPQVHEARSHSEAPPRNTNIASDNADSTTLSRSRTFSIGRPSVTKPTGSNFVNKPVASASFTKKTQLPYFPRAEIKMWDVAPTNLGAGMNQIELEARDMNNWTFQLGSVPCQWSITNDPPSFTLIDRRSRAVLAKMIFSDVGTSAAKGAEIGQFDIFDSELFSRGIAGLSEEEVAAHRKQIVESMICSYALAVTHHLNMGKKFRSNVRYTSYRQARPVLSTPGVGGVRRLGLMNGVAAWSDM